MFLFNKGIQNFILSVNMFLRSSCHLKGLHFPIVTMLHNFKSASWIRISKQDDGLLMSPPEPSADGRKPQTRLLFWNRGQSSVFRRSLAELPPAWLTPGEGIPVWTVGSNQAGTLRRDEAPFGRCRAAVCGRLLRLPAVTERREWAVEADAAGRAVSELHACGEQWQGSRLRGTSRR